MAKKAFQILESTSSDDWNFIEGVKNPADLCSRGVFYPTQLVETDKHGRNWLSESEFLYDNNTIWNTQTVETLHETNPEIRKAETFVAINVFKENILIHIQYESWSKMIRGIGWVLRICFSLKARKLKGVTRHALTVMELLRAEKMCKEIQLREFIEEYPQLGNKEVVSNKNKLQ